MTSKEAPVKQMKPNWLAFEGKQVTHYPVVATKQSAKPTLGLKPLSLKAWAKSEWTVPHYFENEEKMTGYFSG